jgi:hypothetical protein
MIIAWKNSGFKHFSLFYANFSSFFHGAAGCSRISWVPDAKGASQYNVLITRIPSGVFVKSHSLKSAETSLTAPSKIRRDLQRLTG